MSYYVKTICPRCGALASGAFYEPCQHCKTEVNVNWETVYQVQGARLPKPGTGEGIYRFADFFALDPGTPYVSLGEGNTPLHQLRRLGTELGLEGLYVKDESKNPTMSHKDRMCSLLVTKAMEAGAPGLVIASTGNQGISTAAYAKVAGLPCIIFTTSNVAPGMKRLMQVYGAEVYLTASMQDRLTMVQMLTEQLGFFPACGIVTPPIGSSCYAVDAYKTIAFELYEQFHGELPEWVIVPSSYGDTLYGIEKGLQELKAMEYIQTIPKMVAAEVFGATLASVEQQGDVPVSWIPKPTLQTSIAAASTTYLTVRAIRESNGTAVSSGDEQVLQMQRRLLETEGIYAELSSCAALSALKQLIDRGAIKRKEKVAVILTSTGLKDMEATCGEFPNIPKIETTDLDHFLQARELAYGVSKSQ